MHCLKRKISGFSLMELIIVLGIIAVLLATLTPAFSGIIRDKKIEAANKNAQLVLMSLQNYLGKYDYENKDLSDVAYAVSIYDKTSNKTTEAIKKSDDTLTLFTINLSNSLSEKVRQGSWVAKIDASTYTVKYVVWTEEFKTFTYSDITAVPAKFPFTDTDNQEKYIKDNGYNIFGCYPIG